MSYEVYRFVSVLEYHVGVSGGVCTCMVPGGYAGCLVASRVPDG